MSGSWIALFFVKSLFRTRHFHCRSAHRQDVTFFVRSKLVMWASNHWNTDKVETPGLSSNESHLQCLALKIFLLEALDWYIQADWNPASAEFELICVPPLSMLWQFFCSYLHGQLLLPQYLKWTPADFIEFHLIMRLKFKYVFVFSICQKLEEAKWSCMSKLKSSLWNIW